MKKITISAKSSAYDNAVIDCHNFEIKSKIEVPRLRIAIIFKDQNDAENTMDLVKTVLDIESVMTNAIFQFLVEFEIDLKKFDVHLTTENNNHGWKFN